MSLFRSARRITPVVPTGTHGASGEASLDRALRRSVDRSRVEPRHTGRRGGFEHHRHLVRGQGAEPVLGHPAPVRRRRPPRARVGAGSLEPRGLDPAVGFVVARERGERDAAALRRSPRLRDVHDDPEDPRAERRAAARRESPGGTRRSRRPAYCPATVRGEMAVSTDSATTGKASRRPSPVSHGLRRTTHSAVASTTRPNAPNSARLLGEASMRGYNTKPRSWTASSPADGLRRK